ncbi:MAG: hypothetical protein IPQ10_12915 [Saprospiraceae bacterium]|jgi:hypothetical protein|nr:hypothetical protein [Saprospiraceae bacterium]MBK7795178.1 hypothetical protein [Saprospiraceae bacterium]MBL0261935.1 hypothetical protein [Saprospiraceae bacterium]
MKSHDKNNMWPIPNERDVHYDKEEQLDIIWMKIRKRKRQNIFWILLPICIGFALYNYHNGGLNLSDVSYMNNHQSDHSNYLISQYSSPLPYYHSMDSKVQNHKLQKLASEKSGKKISNDLRSNLNQIQLGYNSTDTNKTTKEPENNPYSEPSNPSFVETKTRYEIKKNQPNTIPSLLSAQINCPSFEMDVPTPKEQPRLRQVNHKKHYEKFSYFIGTFIGRAERNIQGNNEDLSIAIRKDFEKELENIGFQGMISYSFSKHAELISGLKFSQSTNNTHINIQRQLNLQDTNAVVRIEEYSSGLIKEYRGKVDYIVHENLKANYYNKYKMLTIPLQVKTSFPLQRRLNLRIGVGLEISIFHKYYGYKINPSIPDFYQKVDNTPYNNIGIAFWGGEIGISYTLSRKYSIEAGIQFSKSLNNITKQETSFKEGVKYKNIYFSYNYKF